MAIFMDLHIAQGITAEEVARVHQLDLDMQEEVGCRCLTYWVDPAMGSAFCLIDAPSSEKVTELHDRTHKQLPAEIIEVDERLVKAFMGRVKDPELIDFMLDERIPVFEDPAFRFIMILQFPDALEVYPGNTAMKPILSRGEVKQMLVKGVKSAGGRLVDFQGSNWVLSFRKPGNVIKAVLMLKERISELGYDRLFKITVAGGNPVDGSSAIFGKTIHYCRSLIDVITPTVIHISHEVTKLLEEDDLNTLKRIGFLHLNQAEEDFLLSFSESLLENYQHPEFNIQTLLMDLTISRSQLYRFCKKILKVSPNIAIRDFRLSRSLELLQNTGLTVSETSYECGFNNVGYFTKCFKRKFGITPKTYTDLRA